MKSRLKHLLALTTLTLALALCLAVSCSAASVPDGDLYEVLEDGTVVQHFEGPAASLMAENNQDPNLPRLSLPTNLEWGKYYHGTENGTLTEVPGMASWAQGAVGQNNYVIVFYRDDPSGPQQIARTDLTLSDNHIREGYCSSSEGFLLNARKTGDYYFEVRALGDGVKYRDSETVRSETWHFTDPDLRLPTPNPVWDAEPNANGDPVLRFAGGDDPRILARRLVIHFYSDSDNTEPQYGLTTLYSRTSTYQLSSKMRSFGVGSYGVSLRYLSGNVTEFQSSEESPLSPLLYYSRFFGKTLEEIVSSADKNDPDDLLSAVKTVRTMNADKLAESMWADESNEGTAGQIKALEDLAGITSAVVVKPALSDVFDQSRAEVLGAGLNAKPGQSVTLEIDRDEAGGVIPALYANAVPFSIKLADGAGSPLPLREGSLAVPVKLTLPIPDTIKRPGSLLIMQRYADGTYGELNTANGIRVSEGRATFMVRAPGSYVLAERADMTVRKTDDGIHVTLAANPGEQDLMAALAVFDEEGRQIGLSLVPVPSDDRIKQLVPCDPDAARLLRVMILKDWKPVERARAVSIR